MYINCGFKQQVNVNRPYSLNYCKLRLAVIYIFILIILVYETFKIIITGGNWSMNNHSNNGDT